MKTSDFIIQILENRAETLATDKRVHTHESPERKEFEKCIETIKQIKEGKIEIKG